MAYYYRSMFTFMLVFKAFNLCGMLVNMQSAGNCCGCISFIFLIVLFVRRYFTDAGKWCAGVEIDGKTNEHPLYATNAIFKIELIMMLIAPCLICYVLAGMGAAMSNTK